MFIKPLGWSRARAANSAIGQLLGEAPCARSAAAEFRFSSYSRNAAGGNRLLGPSRVRVLPPLSTRGSDGLVRRHHPEYPNRLRDRRPGCHRRAGDEADGHPGMSIAVVRDGKVVYAKGLGCAKPERRTRSTLTRSFRWRRCPNRLAPASSPRWSAMAKWPGPIRRASTFRFRVLSDPYVTKNVTIGDLYAMRSGLPNGRATTWSGWDTTGQRSSVVFVTCRYHLSGPTTTTRTSASPPEPEAVAKAVGVPWERLSKQRIYDPLGMTRTTSDYAEFLASTNRATLHMKTRMATRRTRSATTGPVSSRRREHECERHGQVDDHGTGPGNYQGEQVVAANALQESLVPRATARPGRAADAKRSGLFGYGMNVDTDSTGRMRSFSGAFDVGAATTFALLPSESLGISVFTNAAPIGVPEAVTAEFLDRAETGTVTQDWPGGDGQGIRFQGGQRHPSPASAGQPSAPGPLTNYTGVYTGTSSTVR